MSVLGGSPEGFAAFVDGMRQKQELPRCPRAYGSARMRRAVLRTPANGETDMSGRQCQTGECHDAAKWIEIEYMARVQEISMRIEQRQQLLNYALLAIGGLLTFVGAGGSLISGLGAWVYTLGFVVSAVFLLFALGYLKHDLQIAYNAQYIEQRLRPNLLETTGLPDFVLGWEAFMNSKRPFPQLVWYVHAVLEVVGPLVPLVPFAVLYVGDCYFLVSDGHAGKLSSEPRGWLTLTIFLASVVLVEFLVTLGALCLLAGAQRGISRSHRPAPKAQPDGAHMDRLEARLVALERWRVRVTRRVFWRVGIRRR